MTIKEIQNKLDQAHKDKESIDENINELENLKKQLEEDNNWICKKCNDPHPKIILNLDQLSTYTKERLVKIIEKGGWISINKAGGHVLDSLWGNSNKPKPVSSFYRKSKLETIF